VAALASPFGVDRISKHLFPGLPKLNPGLELANTFGVGFWLRWDCPAVSSKDYVLPELWL